jgi:hypothetical protein
MNGFLPDDTFLLDIYFLQKSKTKCDAIIQQINLLEMLPIKHAWILHALFLHGSKIGGGIH